MEGYMTEESIVAIISALIGSGTTLFVQALAKQINRGFDKSLLLDLGSELRYISTLQTMNQDIPKENILKLKRMVKRLRLKKHSNQNGNPLVSFYYDQLENSEKQDIFNIGFSLGQLEVGILLTKSSKSKEESEEIASGIKGVINELTIYMGKLGISHLLSNFGKDYSKNDLDQLRAKIHNEIRINQKK
jgi:hypothetical protein